MKMEKSSWVFLLLFLTILFMLSIWTIDVSVSAMNISSHFPGEAELTNGFWTWDPTRMYHIGLWLAVVSFFASAMVAAKILLGGEGC